MIHYAGIGLFVYIDTKTTIEIIVTLNVISRNGHLSIADFQV